MCPQGPSVWGVVGLSFRLAWLVSVPLTQHESTKGAQESQPSVIGDASSLGGTVASSLESFHEVALLNLQVETIRREHSRPAGMVMACSLKGTWRSWNREEAKYERMEEGTGHMMVPS